MVGADGGVPATVALPLGMIVHTRDRALEQDLTEQDEGKGGCFGPQSAEPPPTKQPSGKAHAGSVEMLPLGRAG